MHHKKCFEGHITEELIHTIFDNITRPLEWRQAVLPFHYD